MTTLDEILNAEPKQRRRGCAICRDDNAASLMVRIQELGPDGSLHKGKRATSKMRSYCADHAAELWPQLLAVLDGDGS